MRAHVFQHVPFEGLGSIERWLDARDADIRFTRFFTDDRLPALDRVDLLIVMGGPMSVNDEATLRWLEPEKQAIRDAIARDIPVLGVCLGAQLIANALGARVYPNALKEIGWFPVQTVGAQAAVQLPDAVVFHWHGDTFDLPDGAIRLASSAATVNQAFQFKHNVIGLQFHLETTPQAIAAMLDHCRGELVPGPFVQTADDIRTAPADRYATINGVMDGVLTYLAAAPRRD
jgi:GMP synthase-like glutamine amidotransferase